MSNEINNHASDLKAHPHEMQETLHLAASITINAGIFRISRRILCVPTLSPVTSTTSNAVNNTRRYPTLPCELDYNGL